MSLALTVSTAGPPLLPLELLPALRPLPLEGQRCLCPAAERPNAGSASSSVIIHAGISSWWKA